MDSTILLDDKNLCIQILSLTFNDDEDISLMPQNFRERFEEIDFPDFQLSEKKQIEI